jgi:hypothetical protein
MNFLNNNSKSNIEKEELDKISFNITDKFMNMDKILKNAKIFDNPKINIE